MIGIQWTFANEVNDIAAPSTAVKRREALEPKYNMEHLYSMAIDNFEDNCVECQQLKKRIEKFLGEETMKEIMKSKRNKK